MAEDRGKLLHGLAKLVWNEPISRAYEDMAQTHCGSAAKDLHCVECKAVWVPGITCKLRTCTNRNLNKKNRTKRSEKRKRYLEHCQKFKSFEPEACIKLEYECGHCGHKQRAPVRLPKQRRDVQKTIQSKAQSAKERARKRKQNNLANTSSTDTSSLLAKPSLSLNDFLL